MTGILIGLALSWAVLWLGTSSHLSALGFVPTRERLTDFGVGLLLASIVNIAYSFGVSALTHNSWTVNDAFEPDHWLLSGWWVVKSVVFEELLFRGTLLYVLWKRAGERTACLLSAAAFGIYHWFTMNALGNGVAMVYLFVTTGLWGLMYAYAFVRTRSLYLPVALHFGWNFCNIVVFSQGPLGHQWLVNSNNGEQLGGWASLAMIVLQVLVVPAGVWLYLRKSPTR